MNGNQNKTAVIVRWAARVWSILPIFWAFAEIIYPHVDPGAEITLVENISLVLLYACVGGLILAWVKELAGALITLGSLAAFVVVFLLMGADADVLIFVGGLGIPAILFYIAWWLDNRDLLEEAAEVVVEDER